MIKFDRIKKIVLIFALLLVQFVVLVPNKSLAYFYSYVEGSGIVQINYAEPKTKLVKRESNKLKKITMENTNDIPCFVRVKIILPSKRTCNVKSVNNTWEDRGDGYWYYKEVLNDNRKVTDELIIEITDNSGKKFNYVVIAENCRAIYDDYNVLIADWNSKI